MRPNLNYEALMNLRRVVEQAPDDRLHMNTFVNPFAKCGTAYCAVGWAAVDPWFQQYTKLPEYLYISDKETGDLTCNSYDDPAQFLADIFGITKEDADNVFMLKGGWLRDHDVAKHEVLDNIDRLIGGESAYPYAALVEAERRRFEERGY
jgi:hypothetical protein